MHLVRYNHAPDSLIACYTPSILVYISGFLPVSLDELLSTVVQLKYSSSSADMILSKIMDATASWMFSVNNSSLSSGWLTDYV